MAKFIESIEKCPVFRPADHTSIAATNLSTLFLSPGLNNKIISDVSRVMFTRAKESFPRVYFFLCPASKGFVAGTKWASERGELQCGFADY